MRTKLIILGTIAAIIIAVAMFMFFRNSSSSMRKFASGTPTDTSQNINTGDPTSTAQPAKFCPQPEGLIKDGVKWVTADRKWENYTPSSATKILNFLGAQWVGVKVGKIICLYQTNEAVAFPVALEQTRSLLALEPKNLAWSALVVNRKFCKSASVADCPYFLEAPKDISNIYKEIEYAPDKEDANM